jgi:hypothetical protein
MVNQAGHTTAASGDPLPSWNEGAAKASIVSFVRATTDAASPDYVRPEERIATFDNDGTLWTEQPYYIQFAFAVDQIKALAPRNPDWQDQEPFKSMLTGNAKSVVLTGDQRALVQIVAATHFGMTTDEFDAEVQKWLASARHPHTRVVCGRHASRCWLAGPPLRTNGPPTSGYVDSRAAMVLSILPSALIHGYRSPKVPDGPGIWEMSMYNPQLRYWLARIAVPTLVVGGKAMGSSRRIMAARGQG